jgi:hypothetical protein
MSVFGRSRKSSPNLTPCQKTLHHQSRASSSYVLDSPIAAVGAARDANDLPTMFWVLRFHKPCRSSAATYPDVIFSRLGCIGAGLYVLGARFWFPELARKSTGPNTTCLGLRWWHADRCTTVCLHGMLSLGAGDCNVSDQTEADIHAFGFRLQLFGEYMP